MDHKRIEWRVGVFVFIGLVVLAVLMLNFNKGTTPFRKTRTIYLHAPNVGGLKLRASVQVSGVQIGTVSEVKLAPNGKSVTLKLSIVDPQPIYSDAEFVIQQAGILGDHYVAIKPRENKGEPLPDGADAYAVAPFDLQEVARSAAGFIQRIDETAQRLNAAIDDVRRLALNENTLSNLSVSVGNMREASERALTTLDSFKLLIVTNAPAVEQSASNIVVFSENLKHFSGSLNDVLETNRDELNVAVKNFEAATAALKTIMEDVQAGKGTAGTLLHNEEVAANVASIADNLSIATSNLNRLGLWKFMWHKEPPHTNPPPAQTTVKSPKDSKH
jgi:phospholipid/cholesterol/gamma-HCH transport system substrate-binding protein